MADKVVATVYETSDYGKFSGLDGNRDIHKNHYSRLRKSHEQATLFSPILVTKNGKGFKIIDGHHRFNVREELGMPIEYVEVKGYGIKEVQRLNANSKTWGWKDYLKCYVSLGNKNYEKFQKMIEDYQFGYSCSVAIITNRIGNGGGLRHDFKDGHLRFKDSTEVRSRFEKIADFRMYYTGYKRRSFVLAVLMMMKHTNYDHKRMMSQCDLYGGDLVDCANWKLNLDLLEELYNRDMANKLYIDRDLAFEEE